MGLGGQMIAASVNNSCEPKRTAVSLSVRTFRTHETDIAAPDAGAI